MGLQRCGHNWATSQRNNISLKMCKVIRGTTKVVVAHLCLTLCDPLQSSWTSLMAQMVKNSPAKWETWVWSLGWELPLEKGKGYPLQYSGLEKSKGLQRVRHDWRTFTSLCDHMDCSPPGFSVHGILQAKIKEWVAISFSRGSSRSRDQTGVSCTAGRFCTIWATREATLWC